ncbi:MAG TPA: hypothetical protein VLA68_00385, partial [Nitrososphaera sp.]|nr:hypothetical protein [Nitrososphaera sp.]
VVKRSKPTKDFHEFLISYTYSLLSLLLAHPSRPTMSGEIVTNEGNEMRHALDRAGIPTPHLISINDTTLIEEFVQGGNLYAALASGSPADIARNAGLLTGRLHKAGLAFIDNKAQNYLVRDKSLVRTDLGFTRRNNSGYARSMDIGSFLASVIDLRRYSEIERAFFDGYLEEYGCKFPYLSIILRNVLSLGFSSNSTIMLTNMRLDSRPLVDV